MLTQAVSRYVYVLNHFNDIARKNVKNETHIADNDNDKNNSLGNIRELRIELSAPCEDYPHFGMDEICKYRLFN